MTPADYVNEIVMPTLKECRDDRTSQRRAYLACIVVHHLGDYIEVASRQTRVKIDQKLREVSGSAFDVVRGVCNAAKHAELTRKHEIPFRPGQDWYRPPAFLGSMVLGLSYLGDIHGGREFQHENRRYDLYLCARKVLNGYLASYPEHLIGCGVEEG